jgi:hypothetical protein
MPKPYEAPSLVRLHEAEQKRWPGTETNLDGWICDDAHPRTSAHCPDSKGCVHARDSGIARRHKPTMLAARLYQPSTRLVIHNRRIWHRHVNQMAPSVYMGKNPHETHIHEQIEATAGAESSKLPWLFFGYMPLWPLLQLGSTGEHVKQLQAYLNGYWYPLAIDGDLGPKTAAAVAKFQVRFGIRNSVKIIDGVRVGDGRVGPHTRQALRVS